MCVCVCVCVCGKGKGEASMRVGTIRRISFTNIPSLLAFGNEATSLLTRVGTGK